jgi:peptide/nickel transport system permease protein
MIGVSFITFAVMNLLPGGTAVALTAGEEFTPAELHALEVKLHLNEPFFTRYYQWLEAAFHGSLGKSLATSEPVVSILSARLPVTAELVIIAMFLAIVAAIVFAVLAVRKRGGIADRLVTSISSIGLAVPIFVLALIVQLVIGVHFRLLPVIGFKPISAGIWPNLRTVILPSSTLGFGLFCTYVRVLRADLVDQMLNEDYVMVAESKGISDLRVLTRHALRNSLFTLLTLVGLNLGVLLGGTLLVEEIFDLPGIGQQLYQSILLEDVTAVEGIVVALTIAVVLANLLTDLLYAVLDPRIRYGRSGS